jgi:hypothetical protein
MNWLAFTSPWLLGGLAAVGLPVLIHYLTRARPRRIAFPPYKFLIEACAGQQAVHRLRTIILLAVRCLAVLVLVLLFTRPFLKPAGAAANLETAKRVVLIVDASLSMRAAQRGVPLFARAQAEAADVLRSLESGSEAAVVLVGATPRPLLPALSRNLPALHEELVKAQPTYEVGDQSAALALAGKMLGAHGIIYVFSDFQESNWKSVQPLAGGISCRLRPVGSEPVDNVAITSARVFPSEPVAGELAEIVCTVFNCTSRGRQETVRLELGEFTQERTVTVPPFGSTDAGFNLTFPRAGTFAGKVVIQPDDLSEDNVRYLVVHAHKALQLLLISDSDANDQRSAPFFISHALVPSAEAAPGLNLVLRHSQDADRGVLETANVFLLAPPATLTGETLEVISRRINEGAQLIAFLDAPSAPMIAAPAFSPPFQLIQAVKSDEGEPVVPGPRKLFSDADPGDWTGIKFHRHYRTLMSEGRGGDVLLSHADGSAALTVSSVGKGSAAFVNIPVTPDGGDLVGSPMFPAMLHELLRNLRGAADEPSATPGNSWTLEITTGGDGPIHVTDPEGHAVDAKVVSSGRQTRLELPVARVPGIYMVQQSGAAVAGGVVNVDSRESDTRPIALQKIQGLGGADVSTFHDEESLLGEIKARPLWPQLASIAAGLIALEMLLLSVWRRSRMPAASVISESGSRQLRTEVERQEMGVLK